MRRKSEEGRGGKRGEKGAGMGGEELEERRKGSWNGRRGTGREEEMRRGKRENGMEERRVGVERREGRS